MPYPTFGEREKIPDRLEGIRQKQADKDLYVAHWYERTKRPEAAQFYYKLILKDYPDNARGRGRAHNACAPWA